jgi:hypothetical protein
VVDRLLPKQDVVGSNPIARSILEPQTMRVIKRLQSVWGFYFANVVDFSDD